MARIIIADDDELVAEIAYDALTSGGHIVGRVFNGTDAWTSVRYKKPDLVILDCNMPELGGITVLREMRKSAELCETPVLMLTGRRSESDVQIARHEGADDYMKKPFNPDELVFRCDELLRKRARAITYRRRSNGQSGRFAQSMPPAEPQAICGR